MRVKILYEDQLTPLIEHHKEGNINYIITLHDMNDELTITYYLKIAVSEEDISRFDCKDRSKAITLRYLILNRPLQLGLSYNNTITSSKNYKNVRHEDLNQSMISLEGSYLYLN
jgi:hypothetical protein